MPLDRRLQIRLHQVGVYSDDRVHVAGGDVGGDAAQVRVASLLDRLLPERLHAGALARHGASLLRHLSLP